MLTPPEPSILCFLCETNPVTWPGTGLCEPCSQEIADIEHRAWAEIYERMAPAERAQYDADNACQEE